MRRSFVFGLVLLFLYSRASKCYTTGSLASTFPRFEPYKTCVVAPPAKVLEIHPELKDLGSGKEAKKALEDALIEAWELVDDGIIEAIWRVCVRDMIILSQHKGGIQNIRCYRKLAYQNLTNINCYQRILGQNKS